MEFKGIRIGNGKPEWGTGAEVFIIELGKVISNTNENNKK